MRNSINFLSAGVFVLLLSGFKLSGQTQLEQIKAEDAVFSMNSIADYDRNYLIEQLLPGWGEQTTSRIIKYANEKYWPSAINTVDKRSNPETGKKISKYKMYLLLDNVGRYLKTSVLYIPKDENAKMPEGYVPETDFFFLVSGLKRTGKFKAFDIHREDNLCPDTYNFLNLPEMLNYYSYEPYKKTFIRKGPSGNNYYQFGKNLTGFYENAMVETPRKVKYFEGCYDAGTDLNQARLTYKHFQEWMLSNDYHVCKFTSSPLAKTYEEEVDELHSEKCRDNPVVIRMKLVANSFIENQQNKNKGYTIMLTVKEPEIPDDDVWNKLYDNIDNEMIMAGYSVLCKEKAMRYGLDCKFTLSWPKEVHWIIYTSDADLASSVTDEKYHDVAVFGAPKPYLKNIWKLTANARLSPGSYSTSGNAKGRWLVCSGEKTDAAAQTALAEELKKEKELMDWAETGFRQKLNEGNYQDIKSEYLYYTGEDDYVNISLYGAYKIQVLVATFNSGVSVEVFDDQGNSIEKAKMVENKGMYFYGVYFEAAEEKYHGYKVLVHYPGNGKHNSVLFYGLKK